MLFDVTRPLSREIEKHWNPCEDDEDAVAGTWPVACEGVAQQRGGYSYKDCRDQGISPHAIRPRCFRMTPSEDKNRAAGNHIEQPFGEDSEREELLETSSQQQQG